MKVKHYKNLFVFHPAGIGDAVLDISSIYQIINATDHNQEIHYIGNYLAKPIIELSGLKEQIKEHYISFPLDIKSIIKLILLRNKIDCLIVLGGMNLKKVGYLKYLLKPKFMYGSLTDDPKECINKIVPKKKLYDFIEGPHEGMHRVQLNLLLFKKIGINASLNLKGFDKKLVEKIPISNNLNLVLPNQYITIHISNNIKYKTLPKEHWKRLIEDLIEKYNLPIIILGNEKEKAYCSEIIKSIPTNNIIDLLGKSDLYQTIKIISNSSIMVSIDSGLSHIAAALKIPLVSIYGPTKISQIAPLDTIGYTINYPLECSNCYWSEKYYNCEYSRKCLSEISTNAILKAVEMTLNPLMTEDKFSQNGSVVIKIRTPKDLNTSFRYFI